NTEAAGEARVRAGGQVVTAVVDPVELEFQVGIQVPVHARADAVHDTALDAVEARAVVEVGVGVAGGDFPGAQGPVQAAVFIADKPGGGEGASASDVIATEPDKAHAG